MNPSKLFKYLSVIKAFSFTAAQLSFNQPEKHTNHSNDIRPTNLGNFGVLFRLVCHSLLCKQLFYLIPCCLGSLDALCNLCRHQQTVFHIHTKLCKIGTMDTNNNPRPTSSFYSGDGDQGLSEVPLRNLGPNSADPSPEPRNVDWALFRAKQERDKKNRIAIISLIAMVAFLSATAAVLGTLYGLAKAQPPQVLTKTAISTSIMTTTSILPVTQTVTASLPPITETSIQTSTLPPLTTTLLQTTTTPLTLFSTETLPPVTQTTTQSQTEISLVTTIITTTFTFTTTQTTTPLTSSSTVGAQDPQRCTVNYEYGGEDLHDLDSDYDLLMLDALQRAVAKGLDISTGDSLTVAMRSVFECAVTDVLDLVEACKSGYVHDTGGVYCDSMGSYPTHSVASPTAAGLS